jgi:histidyl-tRNA synthetase
VFLEAIGLGGDDKAGQRLNVLRAIDKLDKFGPEGVAAAWSRPQGRVGDFTKGAALNDDQIAKVIFFIGITDYAAECAVRSEQRSLPERRRAPRASKVLNLIGSLVTSAGYESGRIKIDPSVVRGLEYYTVPVFEAELQFAVTNEKGEKVVFGSVGGGGRYDGLVSRFMGQPVPATGFSIGVSRLMTALKNLGKLGMEEVIAPVVVCVMDRDTESLGKYQQFTQALRHAGIRAEMYQGNKKNFGDQLKYADRRGSPLAIIQGGDERAQGVVQIKDLIEGKRLSGEIEDNTAWREARVAQVSVPEADLVAKVREMLAEQAEDRLGAANKDLNMGGAVPTSGLAVTSLFSPAGRRWREAPDEGEPQLLRMPKCPLIASLSLGTSPRWGEVGGCGAFRGSDRPW